HHFLGVGLGIRAAFTENARRPEPEHLIAASHRLEAKLLVMRKLLFEAFLALVECRHAAPRTASVKLHAHGIESGLAYRPQTVKTTSGRVFAAKIRSGKRGRGVIVLPRLIG